MKMSPNFINEQPVGKSPGFVAFSTALQYRCIAVSAMGMAA
jgi:hypothetical protein